MYIARREVQVVGAKAREFRAQHEALRAGMKSMPGFRWAMLLRSMDEPGKMATVEMWETYESASAWAESEAHSQASSTHPGEGVVSASASGYDVTTARGSMTPATAAAIVEWEIDDGSAKAFTDRWNAAYHHIEDRVSSRLGRHLSQPARFAGFHVARAADALTPEVLSAELREGESFAARPTAVDRYDVVLLTEA
jgi:heme-degrading monooxygenase HmoA